MKKIIIKSIILILLLLSFKNTFVSAFIKYKNYTKVTGYFNNNSNFNYINIMILKIPVINLNLPVEKAEKNYSNLDTSLVYNKNNDYKSKIVIFGHSGIGYGTFFNRIDEIKNQDNVYLYIQRKKITYYFKKKYVVDEHNLGILEPEKNVLLLVTCDKSNKRKRLVLEFGVKTVKNLKKQEKI